MEIGLKTDGKLTNIAILNTNHRPWKIGDYINIHEYWNNVNSYVESKPTNYIKVWCTVNHWQVSRNSYNNKVIGNWDSAKNTKRRNG